MWTEERLNKMLTTPSEALSGELGRLEGDILVLGAGGKMGPTLCVLAKNALRAAGVEKRVIAVSRFSDRRAGQPAGRGERHLHGGQKVRHGRQ